MSAGGGSETVLGARDPEMNEAQPRLQGSHSMVEKESV